MDKKGNSYENIPEELKKNGRFCVYRKEKKRNKTKKVPYQPLLGINAKTNQKKYFSNYEDALEDYKWIPNQYDGIGVLLTDNLCLIDIDNCLYENELSPLAKRIFYLMNSYTEISPSGNGIHILFYSSNKKFFSKSKYYLKNPGISLETYLSDTSRYTTLTGNLFDKNHKLIFDRSEEYKKFLEDYMRRPKSSTRKRNKKDISPENLKRVQEISDVKLLEIMKNSKNGDKFFEVFFRGNTEDFPSSSEADMFLAGFLAFFCAKDKDRIKKFMEQSALYRNKWNRDPNYLDRTIKKAINNCHTVYDPNWKKGSH